MSTRSPLPLFFHDRSTSPPTGLLSLHRVGSDRIESMHIPRATEREREREDDSSFVRDPAARFFRTLWFLKPRHFLREGRAIAAEKERGEKKEWNAPPRLPLVHRVHNFRNSGLSAEPYSAATSLYSGPSRCFRFWGVSRTIFQTSSNLAEEEELLDRSEISLNVTPFLEKPGSVPTRR